DDHSWQPFEERAMPVPNGADAIERATVGHDEEVVARVGTRVEPKALDPGQLVVQGGRRIGADEVGRRAEPFGEHGDADAGAERVRVRVLVAYGEDAARGPEPLDDRFGDRLSECEIERHGVRLLDPAG